MTKPMKCSCKDLPWSPTNSPHRERPPPIDSQPHAMSQPIDIDYVGKALIGMASPLVGLVTSYQEQIEWHLRVSSLLIGLAVGIMSLVSMVRKLKRR